MKVVMINSSPHEFGCTYTALNEIAGELANADIDCEIIHIGKDAIHGCTACGQCRKLGKCVFEDAVNKLTPKLIEADGLIFGSPVYYAGMSGQLKCFMDRLFFSSSKKLAHKPAAAVVSARRGGCTAAFDDINKYFSLNSMPIVTSQYWNQVHGFTPGDVRKDEEGLQTMRTLARNMAWLLHCFECAKQNGISLPQCEPGISTNFIR